MKNRQSQRGTILVLAVIAIPVILAGLGLVIDNGHAYDTKRRLQKAADAAAIAAAQELRRGKVGTFRDAAIENASLNGVEAPAAEINIFNPPKTGKRAGDPAFVEVELRRESPLYFMRAFYEDALVVEARAIAGVTPKRQCVIALNTSASPGLQVGGSASVNFGDCGVHVNSESSTAARSVGGGTLQASSIDIAGEYSGNGFSPPPMTGSDAAEDPLVDLPAPTIGKCDSNNLLKVQSAVTLNPGVYCGGIEITGQGKVTFKPGVYVLKGGGLTVRGGGVLEGDEVMFYNTGPKYGPFDISSNSLAKLSAPTTGLYAGILFFTDRTITSKQENHFSGNSESYFTGAFYFPSTSVTFTGTSGMQIQKMLIIADSMTFMGNTQIESPSINEGLSPMTLEANLVY
jgi:hypothetical protein